MPLTVYDRVQETTTTSGTGTVSLLGAVTGYRSFALTVGNGNQCYYVICDQSGSNWECGIGTYTSSGSTLSRTTVLASSNSGSLVSFGTNTKNVFVDVPASILNSFVTSTVATLSDLVSVGTITTGEWEATAIAAQYGGTGVNAASAADGDLLIGNGSGFTLATLTQGSGITITNGTGSITIAATSGSPTVSALFTGSATTTVGNTITETTLIPSGVGTFQVPSGLVAGSQLDFTISGYFSSFSIPGTLTFNFYLAGSVVATAVFSMAAGLTGAYWEVTISLTCLATGSGGTCWVNGRALAFNDASGTVMGDSVLASMTNSSATTLNTTTTSTLNFTSTFNIAHVQTSITSTNVKLIRSN